MKTIALIGLFLFAVGCGNSKSKEPTNDGGRQAENPSSGSECLLPSLSGKQNSEIAQAYARLAFQCPHVKENITGALHEK